MRVFHVITGLGNGGAEAVLLRLISKSQSQNFQHYVVSLSDFGIYAERLQTVGARVYALNFKRGRFSVSGLLRLFVLLRQVKPDVVQTWMYHSDFLGGIVARFAGVRAIAWGIRHSNLDPAHNKASTLAIVKVCSFLSRWIPRKIISCSTKATAAHVAVGYQAKKFVFIPNGFNTDQLSVNSKAKLTLRNELKISRDKILIGMVARYDVQKDHATLIRSLSLLKKMGVQYCCLLVGVGMSADNSFLMNLLVESDIVDHVILLGPRNDVPQIMAALDMHVLSSLGEAFPNVLAEAMACGTPCITTDVGDAAEIVGGFGWVVPPQDPIAFSNAIQQASELFFSDELGWSDLQAACRARIVNNYDVARMCDLYHEAWFLCLDN